MKVKVNMTQTNLPILYKRAKALKIANCFMNDHINS